MSKQNVNNTLTENGYKEIKRCCINCEYYHTYEEKCIHESLSKKYYCGVELNGICTHFKGM